MNKPIVNVDMDGVLYPFIDTFRDYFLREEDWLPPVPTQWDVWKDWGMTQEQWLTWFRRGVDDGVIWSVGQPVEGAVDALWTLDEAGFFIRIVTNRLVLKSNHFKTIHATSRWLEKNMIPYHSLCMLGGESKATLTGVALIDDKPGNVDDFRWAKSILFGQPWNADYEGHATRVEGWPEVLKEVSYQ